MRALQLGIVWVLLLRVSSQDATSDLLNNCCTQGESQSASRGISGCRGLSPPTGEVAPQDQELCREVMSICCLNVHRTAMCQRGKDSARSGRITCESLMASGGTETLKDCCDGCKVGLSLGRRGADCNSQDLSLGSPWEEAMRECCNEVPRRTPPGNNPAPHGRDSEPARNRCDANPSPCADLCQDPGFGAVQCSCRPGHRLGHDRKSCTDIDECAEQLDNCDPIHTTCLNSPGSFHCVDLEDPAPSGNFPRRNGNPDHQRPLPPHPARNQPGTVCPSGYLFNSSLRTCDDVDECLTRPCDPRAQSCANTVGSFSCQPLQDNSANELAPQCPRGFKVQPGQGCIDIDECADDLDDCDQSSEYCLNAYGSFQCQSRSSRTCPAGYKQQEGTCTDVDECQEDLHACQEGEETCRNTAGGYVCDVICPPGSTLRKDTGQCQAIPVADHNPFQQSPASCPAGYKHRSPGDQSCVDVDECREDLHSCDLGQERCANREGSFECLPLQQPLPAPAPLPPFQGRRDPPVTPPLCPPGSKFDQYTRTCKDIDECTDDRLNDCDVTTQRCVNIPGSFECVRDPSRTQQCGRGFIFDLASAGCRDLDECQSSPPPCPAGTNCLNLRGSYRCDATPPYYPSSRNDSSHPSHDYCRKGYEWNSESRSCVDVDECRDGSACSQSQCENTVGSFRCGCSLGYTLDPIARTCTDLNECQLGLHNCASTQRCDNTVGSFACVRMTSCGTGYTLNAQTGQCEDDDECALRHTPCGRDFACRNTLGSFRCDRITCEPGERLQADGTCQPPDCPAGMKQSPLGNCADVDECANGEARCRGNQRCVNTHGSYSCQSNLVCGGGYEPDSLGNQCLDVDECVERSHECSANQICRNRPGGYSCECPNGFTLNNKRDCEDVDECTRFAGQVCSISSQCQNTVGSYLCDCKPGFSKGSTGQTCSDVDECRDNPSLCQHNCINTWGGFQCTCRPGFTLGTDNRSCSDIDECNLYKDKGNLCIGFCVNEPGSFSCSCPDGYRLGGDRRTCQDINECQEQGVCSAEDQVCLNTRGGYKCSNITCPPNYVRDKEHRNRCKKAIVGCERSDSACLAQPVSYSYNFLTFVSRMKLPPTGQLDLFTMRGPRYSFTSVQFQLDMKDARAPVGVQPAVRENFHLRNMAFNEAMVSLVKSLEGPQEIELELQMKMYHNGLFGGTAIAKLNIVVSRYEF